MLERIHYIYRTPDLYGDALTRPLKAYHSFFAERVEKCPSRLRTLAWQVARLATGILAYPCCGLLAGSGLVLKAMLTNEVERHNDNMKALLTKNREKLGNVWHQYIDDGCFYIDEMTRRCIKVVKHNVILPLIVGVNESGDFIVRDTTFHAFYCDYKERTLNLATIPPAPIEGAATAGRDGCLYFTTHRKSGHKSRPSLPSYKEVCGLSSYTEEPSSIKRR